MYGNKIVRSNDRGQTLTNVADTVEASHISARDFSKLIKVTTELSGTVSRSVDQGASWDRI